MRDQIKSQISRTPAILASFFHDGHRRHRHHRYQRRRSARLRGGALRRYQPPSWCRPSHRSLFLSRTRYSGKVADTVVAGARRVGMHHLNYGGKWQRWRLPKRCPPGPCACSIAAGIFYNVFEHISNSNTAYLLLLTTCLMLLSFICAPTSTIQNLNATNTIAQT